MIRFVDEGERKGRKGKYMWLASITASHLSRVVDQAMKACVSQWASPPSVRPGLTHQDLFYTEVARLDDIIGALLSVVESHLQSLRYVLYMWVAECDVCDVVMVCILMVCIVMVSVMCVL